MLLTGADGGETGIGGDLQAAHPPPLSSRALGGSLGSEEGRVNDKQRYEAIGQVWRHFAT